MCRELVDLVQRTINSKYTLEREDKSWFLNEAKEHGGEIAIRAANRYSFAFSLDHPNQDNQPLAFFSAQPPGGIAKMCDAIMVCHHKQQCYLFLIERKTAHRDDYRKQLHNGKFFCDWLLRLYEEHGHVCQSPVFIGLLIWFPRRSPPRQGTAHGAEGSGIRPADADKEFFDHSFKIENQKLIPTIELFKQLAGAV